MSTSARESRSNASVARRGKWLYWSAGDELPLKCKNCTLEEVAVLRIVQKSPSATQKQIAAEIGKPERTIKSITIALQEKNILQRVNGKRNGYWSFIED